jgi:hypothetical protein
MYSMTPDLESPFFVTPMAWWVAGEARRPEDVSTDRVSRVGGGRRMRVATISMVMPTLNVARYVATAFEPAAQCHRTPLATPQGCEG